MLAHLKAKQRRVSTTTVSPAMAPDQQEAAVSAEGNIELHKDNAATTAKTVYEEEKEATQMTCDVLCSLSTSCPPPMILSTAPCDTPGSSSTTSQGGADSLFTENGILQTVPLTMMTTTTTTTKKKSGSKTSCPKHLQLPMFLSKTYHMIDRCDPDIATWSDTGDNFVVKNVEKFASSVLPLYFKHSNFSSFARQLNFYGFRKLRTDPILTSDVDPRTACYVRFYHEKFQKDKPDLLHQIKRATKTDQQSKDDVDCLKQEVAKLKDVLIMQAAEYDRKLAELSYECNRRITAMNAEYDKLAALVHRAIAGAGAGAGGPGPAAAAAGPAAADDGAATATTAVTAAAAAAPSSEAAAAAQAANSNNNSQHHHHHGGGDGGVPDLLQSLSHAAAVSLQNQQMLSSQALSSSSQTQQQQQCSSSSALLLSSSVLPSASSHTSSSKRPFPEEDAIHGESTTTRPRYSL